MSPASEHYPAPAEVDAWCERVMRRAEAARLQVELLEDETWPFRLGVRHTGGVYLAAAAPALGRFYCFWQPCPSGRGPLLVHLPGYGSEMSAHPELVADGYNVLHVNPLGHATPQGPDESRRPDGEWPVLPETVRSLGQKGYVEWLTGASAAVLWALDREEVEAGRLGFFGTSQGGGTAMLLASTFRDRHVRAVAADLPFLVNFPLVQSM
ncbi:MAG: acetylxylan esterase, partial [Candidatus Brocadiaceae bacterium]